MFSKKKKKPLISPPSNFEHRVHTGFDRREGKFVGLPLQWASLVGNNQVPTKSFAHQTILPLRICITSHCLNLSTACFVQYQPWWFINNLPYSKLIAQFVSDTKIYKPAITSGWPFRDHTHRDIRFKDNSQGWPQEHPSVIHSTPNINGSTTYAKRRHTAKDIKRCQIKFPTKYKPTKDTKRLQKPAECPTFSAGRALSAGASCSSAVSNVEKRAQQLHFE